MGKLLWQILQGAGVAAQIFFLTLLFSLPLGLLVALGRMSKRKYISKPIKVYQLIMRGTPLMLQIMLVFYGPYYIFGTSPPNRFTAVIIAFVINYAAYFAEIYRSGIGSIPPGQYEAAKVLGFSKAKTFFRIILPQVVKRILPSMGNEFMTLVKDTALAYVIGVIELFRVAQTATSRTGSVLPFIVAGLVYFAMNSIVEKGFVLAEKKLDYYQ